MTTSFHRNARCPHIGLKEGGEDVRLTGGLLPFPRTGCVLYAKAILSYCSQIRQALPREGAPSRVDLSGDPLTVMGQGPEGREEDFVRAKLRGQNSLQDKSLDQGVNHTD